MKKRWMILMSAMIIIAVAGLFAKEPSFECDFSKINAADVAWLITATIFVLMMTPGLSFFYGGMVGAKNVISTMLQSFIAMGIISVLWVVFGFSLCFGDDIGGIIGNPLTFLMFDNVGADVYTTPTGSILGGATIPLALYALFQMKFAIITPSLITGSFAERVRFSGYMFFMIFFFVVIYCPLAHMTWHPDGLFLKWGVVDFAGGIVVHASSGVAALAGAIFLGRRHAATRKSEPANIPFVLLGAAMLWLGWFGFNAGSSLHADGVAVKFLRLPARSQAVCYGCGCRLRRRSCGNHAFGRLCHSRSEHLYLVRDNHYLQHRSTLAQSEPHRRRSRRVPDARHGWYLRYRTHGYLHTGGAYCRHMGGLRGVPLPPPSRSYSHRLHLRDELFRLLADRQDDTDARVSTERKGGSRLLPA